MGLLLARLSLHPCGITRAAWLRQKAVEKQKAALKQKAAAQERAARERERLDKHWQQQRQRARYDVEIDDQELREEETDVGGTLVLAVPEGIATGIRVKRRTE